MSSVNAIASLATGQSQAALKRNVGIAVAKKSLDEARQQGEAAISLLEGAAEVARRSTGAEGSSNAGAGFVGGRLDVRA